MILKFASILFLAGFVLACQKEEEEELTRDYSNDNFYYYFNEKIFLTQVMDKILIKFSSDTNKEQILALISEADSLKLTNGAYWYEGPLRFAALESKDEKLISLETLKSLKERDEIISATYIHRRYNGGNLSGIMDDFTVRLKSSTSYEQLKKLAEKNACKIGQKDRYANNQYTLHVSKTSELNAMQMANKFHEAKFVAFAEPNFIILNAIPQF